MSPRCDALRRNERDDAQRRNKQSRKRIMARSRYKFFDNAGPYFITCTIVNWLPVFSRPDAVAILLDSWKFLQAEKRMILYGYVILENHLHCIIAAKDPSKEVANFKSYTARQIIDHLKEQNNEFLLKQLNAFKLSHKTDRSYQLWQEGSHPKLILSEGMMRQKLDYMHFNPVERGYVDDPIHWRYSSARNYAGLKGLLDLTTEWSLFGRRASIARSDAEHRSKGSPAQKTPDLIKGREFFIFSGL